MTYYEGVFVIAIFVGLFSFFGGFIFGGRGENRLINRHHTEITDLKNKHDEEIKSIQRDSDYWREKFNAEIRK